MSKATKELIRASTDALDALKKGVRPTGGWSKLVQRMLAKAIAEAEQELQTRSSRTTSDSRSETETPEHEHQ